MVTATVVSAVPKNVCKSYGLSSSTDFNNRATPLFPSNELFNTKKSFPKWITEYLQLQGMAAIVRATKDTATSQVNISISTAERQDYVG